MRSLLRIPNKKALVRACYRALMPSRRREVSLRQSLETAYAWLCAAQDATPDDGVAAGFSLVKGWWASYPETTGYIIPTFLTYAEVMREPKARERAIRMADWEIDVQLPSGAVRSGTLSTPVGPAVFNTGQVLFGWVSAYQATGEARFARAAQRAAEWLLREQDEDGAWRKNLSLLTHRPVHTYNVRAAWGLALTGHVFDEPRWITAARKNCEWTLMQQQQNGWFRHNGFTKNEAPLLHTIAYTLEGLLGVGELLDEERYVEAAASGALPLAAIYDASRRLRGRYRSNWQQAVRWRCLTGEAQMALVLLRLAKHSTRDIAFASIGRAILRDLSVIQDHASPYPESHGGISGSQPLWGDYNALAYINWAAKFYMDALMLSELGVDVHPPSAAQIRSVFEADHPRACSGGWQTESRVG